MRRAVSAFLLTISFMVLSGCQGSDAWLLLADDPTVTSVNGNLVLHLKVTSVAQKKQTAKLISYQFSFTDSSCPSRQTFDCQHSADFKESAGFAAVDSGKTYPLLAQIGNPQNLCTLQGSCSGKALVYFTNHGGGEKNPTAEPGMVVTWSASRTGELSASSDNCNHKTGGCDKLFAAASPSH